MMKTAEAENPMLLSSSGNSSPASTKRTKTTKQIPTTKSSTFLCDADAEEDDEDSASVKSEDGESPVKKFKNKRGTARPVSRKAAARQKQTAQPKKESADTNDYGVEAPKDPDTKPFLKMEHEEEPAIGAVELGEHEA